MKIIVIVFSVEKALALLPVEINCKILVYLYFHCTGRRGKLYPDLIILGARAEGPGQGGMANSGGRPMFRTERQELSQ